MQVVVAAEVEVGEELGRRELPIGDRRKRGCASAGAASTCPATTIASSPRRRIRIAGLIREVRRPAKKPQDRPIL
jgi:hypothetical protein